MKAKDKFKALGYELLFEDNNSLVWFFPSTSVTLTFWKFSTTVTFDGLTSPYNEFDMEELEAIKLQLKEIGG